MTARLHGKGRKRKMFCWVGTLHLTRYLVHVNVNVHTHGSWLMAHGQRTG